MIYRYAAITTWPGALTRERRYSPFRADHNTTLRQLDYELGRLEAKNVVLELAMRAGDIRQDGMPRADARTPEHPGVILSFDSKFGPLRYATDAYTEWKANLRAIALSLEALRAVDRYGVTRRGEQYTGWRTLHAGTGTEVGIQRQFSSKLEAATYVLDVLGADAPCYPDEMLEFEDWCESAIRQAIKRTHPDAGGRREQFDRVMEAKRILEAKA